MSDDRMSVSVKLAPRRPRTKAMDAVADIDSKPPRPPTPDAPRDLVLDAISAAASAIALAHLTDGWLRDGTVKSLTDAARRLRMTPSRVQQIHRLFGLSPNVQEAVLLGEIDVSVRELELASKVEEWNHQTLFFTRS